MSPVQTSAANSLSRYIFHVCVFGGREGEGGLGSRDHSRYIGTTKELISFSECSIMSMLNKFFIRKFYLNDRK